LAQWWYNSCHHSSIRTTLFEALYGYKPPLLPTIEEPVTVVVVVDSYLQQRQAVLQLLKKELANAQNRMKQFVNRRRSEREFAVGEEVYLKLRHVHLKALSQE